jgi:ABC-type transporter Mla subunit MlaD
MIRPSDVFGDVYLSFDPGRAKRRLGGDIPTSRTADVGRLDDLLHVFQEPERAGLKAMLVELGVALDKRGTDLNAATLRLAPTFKAANNVMTQLASERASLGKLVKDSDDTVGQLAVRTQDLDRLVRSFATLVQSTSAHAATLDQGLQGLPVMLSQLRTTTGLLAKTSSSAQPLAASLRDAAPDLSTAMTRLQPFLSQASSVVQTVRPTLRDATTFLSAGKTSFPLLAQGLASLRQGAPDLHALTQTLVAAAPEFGRSLFQSVAGEALEPGNQPLDPTTNPLRNYWRGDAVLTCNTFGLPIKPGCLADFLKTTSASDKSHDASHPDTPQSSKPAAPIVKAPSAVRLPSVSHQAAPQTTSTPGAQPSVTSLLNYLLGR